MTHTQETARSRMPNPANSVPEIQEMAGLLFRAVGNRSVPRTTIGLMHLRAGQLAEQWT